MPLNHNLHLHPGQYAVLFLSERKDDPPGYSTMDEATMAAVSKLSGFLGWESARQSPVGIFISYWENKEAIDVWRNDQLHARAKEAGKKSWYQVYRTVVCKIEETQLFVRK